MGNGNSRVGGCFSPFVSKEGVDLDFLEPLDEGLGHSFCYVQSITPSNSERFTNFDSSNFDSDTCSGSLNLPDQIPPTLNDEHRSSGKIPFKTISGASVSANAGNQSGDNPGIEPAARFDCTASFTAIPLQPAPHGSGPLDGFLSGPLEKGGFMVEDVDRSNFSAPLFLSGKRPPAALRRLVKSAVSGRWVRRLFVHPAVAAPPPVVSSENGVQWAHGKAGEDRVHVVLSEEQGWLFVGIYDGFSGPDAPDFLMGSLYRAIDKELQGLLWDFGEGDEDVEVRFRDGRRSGRLSELLQMELMEEKKSKRKLRKKMFPWSYDWERPALAVRAKAPMKAPIVRRSKARPAEHGAVLSALRRALEATEAAFMETVEKSLHQNPELALMGSCVLVMLMKDQDVYAMSLGDSRVILAQERGSSQNLRSELDRISEESPARNINNYHDYRVDKNRELSLYCLKLRAVQLTSDHSTDVEEEVARIRTEHPDDEQAVFNGRVKGQLKVTRAFGAGFLKRPNLNEALLEMFRIKYVGVEPYVSWEPCMVHHRLTSGDRFLLLSSDGLYQYFSNEEVVAHVAWFMDNVPEGDPAQYLITELLFRAAKKNGMDFHALLDIPHGDRRKYHDDVSVMVVSLEGRVWRSSG